MLELLSYGIVYILTGYITFRTWARISPPKHGRYDHSDNTGLSHCGWYIPALLNTRAAYSQPRGLSVTRVFVLSIFLWPFVATVMGGRLGYSHGQKFLKIVAQHALPKPEKQVLPSKTDPALVDAMCEVEDYLKNPPTRKDLGIG